MRNFNARIVAWLLVCVVGAPAAAQRARSAGFARFLWRTVDELGPVALLQGGHVVGHGELVGWPGGFAEFRGQVPRGRFRIRSATATSLAGVEEAPVFDARAVFSSVRRGDGVVFRRWHARGAAEGLRVETDLYADGAGGLEMRLQVAASMILDVTRAHTLVVHLRGRRLVPVRLGGMRLGVDAGRQALVVPPGSLRAGDVTWAVLRTGSDATDPSRRVWPERAVLARLGFGVPRDTFPQANKIAGALRDEIRELLANPPTGPVDAGDFLRSADLRSADALVDPVWTHGEFDLALGLELWGIRTGDSAVRDAARRSVRHTLGRDLARGADHGAGELRLPVRHGPTHGEGAVDAGHVFLEGCLLVSALDVDALLFGQTVACLDQLERYMSEQLPAPRRLRELVWPLHNFETALRFVDRGSWARAADQLLARLSDRVDARIGFVVLPHAELAGGRTRIDLWIVAGLLLPALAQSVARAPDRARDLRERLVRNIRALPRRDGVLATHYVFDADGRAFPSAGPPAPTAVAWLIEGLASHPRLRGKARRLARRLGTAPGSWDPATRLALLLRLAWLRPGFGR